VASVNFTLDQRKTSALFSWGLAICSSAGSGWRVAEEPMGPYVEGGSKALSLRRELSL
jgi:hypothetical protein